MMSKRNQSFLYFLVGCMPVRVGLAWLAASATPVLLRVMGWLALLPAVGFLLIFLTGARKSGPETFGEPIWWNALRPVHSALYFAFALLALGAGGARGLQRHAWKALALDAVLGVSAAIAVRC